jgi:Tol biopolymer transport system component
VYFISSRQGPLDIYAQRIDRGGNASGAPVRLTVGLGAQSISLSHDGRALAYAAYTSSANIWSLPLPSGAPISVDLAVPVTRGNQVIENVRASRDGVWLLYDSDLNGTVDLYRIRASGGEPERLTTDSTDEFAPDPSPDGKEIVFHSWRSGSRNIYVLPLDGGPQQQVTSSPAQEGVAIWAPDGSALVYMEVSLTGGIWTVHRASDRTWGTPVRRLPTGFWPNWSPDGKQISYATREFGGNLTVMPADSGPSRTLTDVSRKEPSANGSVWSRDGKTIYFKSHDAKGTASIWSIPSAGGTPRLLVRFDDPLRPSDRYNWTMGNNRIYFPIDDHQSDVWVMDVTSR